IDALRPVGQGTLSATATPKAQSRGGGGRWLPPLTGPRSGTTCPSVVHNPQGCRVLAPSPPIPPTSHAWGGDRRPRQSALRSTSQARKALPREASRQPSRG